MPLVRIELAFTFSDGGGGVGGPLFGCVAGGFDCAKKSIKIYFWKAVIKAERGDWDFRVSLDIEMKKTLVGLTKTQKKQSYPF